jgi:two-component system, NarL family, response regulator LiaR
MIRVLIVDDHRVVRQGLRFALSQEDDVEVVGECADGAEAVAAVRALRPDVVLLDLLMPGTSGLEALHSIKDLRPETEVVVLTSSPDEDDVVAAVRAGARSYLLKTAGVDDVLGSVRAASRGETFLESGVAARLMRGVRRGANAGPLDQLTRREREVLEAIARGMSNREIARLLSIAEETVKTHVSSMLSKLGLADRTQLAIFGLQQGVVPLGEALGNHSGQSAL